MGGVRTKEATEKFGGRILSATVSREADRWCVSLAVEVEREDPQPVEGPVVGVDLGLTSFAVISDGTRIESPKPLAQAERRLRHRQRLHSRKQRGSHNRRKSAAGLARLHRRIRCRRADFLHKATTDLAKAQSVIVVEDLFVQGRIRNHSLARSVTDAGWSECRQMLAYKTQWYGSQLVIAPRFYPSTKTCSACGAVKDEMPLGERVFQCAVCGLAIDRDWNAARNLAPLVAGSFPETQNACGGDGAGRESGPAKLAPVKQEASSRQPASQRTRGNKRLCLAACSGATPLSSQDAQVPRERRQPSPLQGREGGIPRAGARPPRIDHRAEHRARPHHPLPLLSVLGVRQ